MGAPAPAFRLARLEGGEVSLQDLIANGPVALAFFKVSCPVCQLTFPFLERISSPALPVYGVSQNNPAETREYNARFGVTFPTLLDSERAGYPASNAFGISIVPTIVVIERDGTVSRVVEGWSKQEITELGGLAGIQPFRASDAVPEWKAG